MQGHSLRGTRSQRIWARRIREKDMDKESCSMQTEGSMKASGLRIAGMERDFNDLATALRTRALMSTVNLKVVGAINGKTEKSTKVSGKVE